MLVLSILLAVLEVGAWHLLFDTFCNDFPVSFYKPADFFKDNHDALLNHVVIARLSTPLRADVSSVLLEWWQLGCHKGADVRHTQSIMGSDHDGCCQQHLCQHCVHFNCSVSQAATFNPPNLEKNWGQVIRYFLPHRKWQASQLAVKHMKQIASRSSYAYPQPRRRADGCRHLMLGWIFGRNVAEPLSHYRRPCPRLRLEIKMSWPVEVTCN